MMSNAVKNWKTTLAACVVAGLMAIDPLFKGLSGNITVSDLKTIAIAFAVAALGAFTCDAKNNGN